MQPHNEMEKEQLLHMLFGTLVFVVLVSIAVGLDLGANFIQKLALCIMRSCNHAA